MYNIKHIIMTYLLICQIKKLIDFFIKKPIRMKFKNLYFFFIFISSINHYNLNFDQCRQKIFKKKKA